jgi:hypothetical protein
VGPSLLVIASHVLPDAVPYHALGPDSFALRDRQALSRAAVRRLERLGQKGILEPAA